MGRRIQVTRIGAPQTEKTKPVHVLDVGNGLELKLWPSGKVSWSDYDGAYDETPDVPTQEHRAAPTGSPQVDSSGNPSDRTADAVDGV